ncbi:glycoside hydrolase family 140 protein [Echinicola jeungdonensis]|uniref:Glycoside hydrolase family 140 protein n=1 Tax=Echinicola jeungdonensis TaxID=709343 RepID=A0ABV5J3Q2_9BACT|nr:glycoside hydrolase family 140 protein [Echinicola jeungdonensis]MDN3669355.1 glycoside hydrolase family 140 protein [Echinicola jeungdonensis]
MHLNKITIGIAALTLGSFMGCQSPKEETKVEVEEPQGLPALKVSENDRYFVTEKGEPFFWLGDTGWLMFNKLKREETEHYLEDRKQKGYNVIQVMTLHTLGAVNAYGDSALINQNVAEPLITEGDDFSDSIAYDFWDHIDFVVNTAEEKGLYVAMVPVWGNNVKNGGVTVEEAKAYGQFLGERYKDQKNVIWLNGGDTFGNEYTDVWNALGNTLDQVNPNHLITFHPRGRMQSSDWFADAPWMDFHMFQSGHRRYDQDDTERAYGEDNWRYVKADYALDRKMPTVDGEPSYEGIPEGLHDPEEGFWDDDAVRRYAYWAVFAGAAGHTYGHSAVMQMHREQDGEVGAYGNKKLWTEALDDPGAKQMVHLKDLILEFPYLERVPDQSLVVNQGEKYDYLAATRGEDYALVYTYTGRPIEVDLEVIEGENVKARWFNPRNGQFSEIGEFEAVGNKEFTPSGKVQDGNDWVLVLNYM